MKKFYFIIIFLLLQQLRAQELPFSGTVTNGADSIPSVHIENLRNGKYTISNEEGYFELPVKTGDSLRLTHVGYQPELLIVDNRISDGKPLMILMDENAIELPEVTLETYRSMNAVDLGIYQKLPEKLTPNERKLKTAGDFKWYHALGLLGGALAIDPILNKINGRTKNLKKRIAVDRAEALRSDLDTEFRDFIEGRLSLKNEWVDRFLYYTVEHGDWAVLSPENPRGTREFHLIQLHQDFMATLEEVKE
ncbi:hypothetical protein [Robertkochia aurantiaca]|uniref:hypothetical protein n=1 Tax=Robertkochia aurantiaca TaxID=2873700 RepID=UPI001CCC2E6B|nr:hypothetical protein [Robertkochia sp. 3YJGBD-33]